MFQEKPKSSGTGPVGIGGVKEDVEQTTKLVD